MAAGEPCFFSWNANGDCHICFERGEHDWHICDGGGECPERAQVVDVDRPDRPNVKRRKHHGGRQ